MAEAIKNINLGINTKQKFTIDGDKNKVIELDTTDMGIASRLNESTVKIQALQEKWGKENPGEETDLEAVDKFSDVFSELEKSMRDIVDFIFDSPVCDIILGNSSIFSPVNGKYKFEQIIDALSGMYETDIKAGVNKINKDHIKKHTAKYVK